MKPAPLYVKSLFELLRTVGVTQQEVAKALSVSKTTVSFWAHGKEPLSPRYAQEFLDLVADVAAVPAAPQEEYTPLTIDDILRHSKLIQQHLSLWAMERQQTVGQVEQDYRQGCRIIASYAQQDPAKLDPVQWQEVQDACHKIGHARRILTYLRRPPTTTNWPQAPDISRDGIRAALQAIADSGHLKAPAAESEEEDDEA